MKNLLVIATIFLFLVSGCAGVQPHDGSFVGPVPKDGNQNIAHDAIDCLLKMYPPGHTSIRLIYPDAGDDFSPVFETTLREQGFTVSPDGTITISYILDEIKGTQPPEWYFMMSVSAPDGQKKITRSYTNNGQQPVAGYSIMGGRNE